MKKVVIPSITLATALSLAPIAFAETDSPLSSTELAELMQSITGAAQQ